mmetsp:Transcript_103445/g.260470  ORF Transcript_103445/g.260470 Transcript_103445/m.260470 type:complete len:612 (+) Transcript_103445:3244-5079(+)
MQALHRTQSAEPRRCAAKNMSHCFQILTLLILVHSCHSISKSSRQELTDINFLIVEGGSPLASQPIQVGDLNFLRAAKTLASPRVSDWIAQRLPRHFAHALLAVNITNHELLVQRHSSFDILLPICKPFTPPSSNAPMFLPALPGKIRSLAPLEFRRMLINDQSIRGLGVLVHSAAFLLGVLVLRHKEVSELAVVALSVYSPAIARIGGVLCILHMLPEARSRIGQVHARRAHPGTMLEHRIPTFGEAPGEGHEALDATVRLNGSGVDHVVGDVKQRRNLAQAQDRQCSPPCSLFAPPIMHNLLVRLLLHPQYLSIFLHPDGLHVDAGLSKQCSLAESRALPGEENRKQVLALFVISPLIWSLLVENAQVCPCDECGQASRQDLEEAGSLLTLPAQNLPGGHLQQLRCMPHTAPCAVLQASEELVVSEQGVQHALVLRRPFAWSRPCPQSFCHDAPIGEAASKLEKHLGDGFRVDDQQVCHWRYRHRGVSPWWAAVWQPRCGEVQHHALADRANQLAQVSKLCRILFAINGHDLHGLGCTTSSVTLRLISCFSFQLSSDLGLWSTASTTPNTCKSGGCQLRRRLDFQAQELPLELPALDEGARLLGPRCAS